MRGNIRQYAKLGIAHFMFWPECLANIDVHVESLLQVTRRSDIDAIDCCLPFDAGARRTLGGALRSCGKQVGYAIHPFPLDKISLGSLADHERGLARLIVGDQIEAAAQAGARSFTIASGIDLGDERRPACLRAFADFCRWLCPQTKALGMTALLEPFDRGFHRKFLCGPTSECAELADSLQAEGCELKIQLDLAHVRLSGEDFNDAIRRCGKHLGHVHLGNCVMRDASDPFYGDRHPPIGYAGGEIGEAELTAALRWLLDAGYLDPQRRATLVIEARPFPGRSPEETIDDQLARLQRCWQNA